MTNVEKVPAAGDRHSDFVIDSSSVIRHSSFTARSAFTLIELVVVVTVITILAGLVLSTAGYARKKGARARAETEIAAMSAAIESYKADNGVYPNNGITNTLNAQTSGDPSAYQPASQYVYGELSGDRNFNYVIDVSEQANRSYFAFKSSPPSVDGTSGNGMLSITRTTSGGNVTYTVNYIRDPFGNSYGYSTANQADPNTGYNPTFDLWSTAGTTTGSTTDRNQWIKNW
jgi:prepilin-type N-terminal cleavage/methylation domain-containing protein